MMKNNNLITNQKLYLDTSVPSAYYDDEKPERQRITKLWWENDLSGYDVVLSRVTVDELEATNDREKREKFSKLINGFRVLNITPDCRELAKKYIDNNIIPEEAFNDALHVAIGKIRKANFCLQKFPKEIFPIATINKIDILVSWNFSHLVNTNTRHKVNGINLLNNYAEIEISSPYELGGGKYE